jgi:hypothetical protein
MITLRNLLLSASALLASAALVETVAAQAIAPRGLATSLAAPATPTATPGPDGFLQRWMLLEPIPVSGEVNQTAVQATVKKEYFPNQFTVLPKDGDQVTVGDGKYTWHAADTQHYNVNLYQFGYLLNKPTSNVIFWGVTIVNCPEDLPNVRLAIGSNAASVWWVNGQELAGIYGDRQTVIDDGVSKRITLKKGPNVVRVAVVNNGGATDFCARFLDANDQPVTNLTESLSEVAH